jgi:hypothetical protein
MAELRNFDPKSVSVIVGGHAVQGFAEGTFVLVAPNADEFSDVAGSQGEVSRARISDRRADVTITLQQTSPSNDVLSGFAELDRLSPNGAGVVSFLLRDGQGTTLVRAVEGWVKRRPDVEMSNEIKNREWVIRLAEAFYFVGGN